MQEDKILLTGKYERAFLTTVAILLGCLVQQILFLNCIKACTLIHILKLHHVMYVKEVYHPCFPDRLQQLAILVTHRCARFQTHSHYQSYIMTQLHQQDSPFHTTATCLKSRKIFICQSGAWKIRLAQCSAFFYTILYILRKFFRTVFKRRSIYF